MSVELVIQTVAADVKTLHHILTHQVNLCVETLLADDGVDCLKKVLIHCGLQYFSAKLVKKVKIHA